MCNCIYFKTPKYIPHNWFNHFERNNRFSGWGVLSRCLGWEVPPQWSNLDPVHCINMTYGTRSIFRWNLWLVHSKLLHEMAVMCWSNVPFSREQNCLLCKCASLPAPECNVTRLSYLPIQIFLACHAFLPNCRRLCFHQIQNTVYICLLKTTVHSKLMCLQENFLLYWEQEEETDKSTVTRGFFGYPNGF